MPNSLIPKEFLVDEYPFMDYSDSKQAFVDSIRGMKGIEGFVIQYNDGTWAKVKTEEYCALHKTKDNINSPRKLFETCVLGAADDLISMFKDDPTAVAAIEEMQKMVYHTYNTIHRNIYNFFNESFNIFICKKEFF